MASTKQNKDGRPSPQNEAAYKRWAEEVGQAPERDYSFDTVSGQPVDIMYLPPQVDADYLEKLGFPGQYPFTRGAQANMSAYFALLRPGDTVMAMGLAHGGHLTHGAAFNFSGKLYNFVSYEVDRETERIDYDRVEQIAIDRKPNLIVAGASSYPRIIDFERFRSVADRSG